MNLEMLFIVAWSDGSKNYIIFIHFRMKRSTFKYKNFQE